MSRPRLTWVQVNYAAGALAVAAWLGLTATVLLPGGHGAGSRDAWWCMPGMNTTASADGSTLVAPLAAAARGLPMWSLMALAMMLPAAMPAAQHVRLNSLAWRRRRAVSGFLGVYVVVWLGFGLVAIAATAALPSVPPGSLPAGALALASCWELTPLKRWALNRCPSTSPLPPRGWRAHAGVARFGARHGAACIASCWASMLVMLTTQSGRLLWSLSLTGVTMADKLTVSPRAATRASAALLGAAAAVSGLILLTG